MKTRRVWISFVMLLLSVTAVMAKDVRVVVFKVMQMHCGNCEKKVKNNIRFEKGVKDLVVDLKAKTVSVTYDADKTNVDALKEGFKKLNYQAEVMQENKK